MSKVHYTNNCRLRGAALLLGLLVANLAASRQQSEPSGGHFRQPKLMQHFQPAEALHRSQQQAERLVQEARFKPMLSGPAPQDFFKPAKIQEHQAAIVNQQEELVGRSWGWGSGPAGEENSSSAGCRAAPRAGALRRVLQSAKNMLTGGLGTLERSALGGGHLLVLGSSVLAAAIPLVAFLMPDFSSAWRQQAPGSGSGIAIGPPLPATGSPARSGLSLHGQLDSAMGWIERSVEHLPNFPRLHPQECVKRSICEAHNEPSKFGALGFILRLLFPASNLSSTDRMDNMEFKVINKYRHAAGFGASRRLEANGTAAPGACKEKYEDCLVSLLEVSQSLMDIFLK